MFEDVPLLLKLYQLGAISLCSARVVNEKCFVCFFERFSLAFSFFSLLPITLNNFGSYSISTSEASVMYAAEECSLCGLNYAICSRI